MALRCFISGKKTVVLKKVSHSHVRTNKKVKPNLQTVSIIVGNNKKKVQVCARMIKKGKTTNLRLTMQQYKQMKNNTARSNAGK